MVAVYDGECPSVYYIYVSCVNAASKRAVTANYANLVLNTRCFR